jgi:APA family basic amino acid/polyamine antiporter
MAEEKEEKGVFVRKASGLLRPLGAFAVFMTCLQILSIGVGGAWIPAIFGGWIGCSITMSFIIITIFAVIHSIASSQMTGAMPRSGGIYVWVSRIIHPAWGFASNASITIYDTVLHGGFVGLLVSWGIGGTLYMLGLTSGDSGLISLSQSIASPWITVIVGTILLVVLSAIAAFGLRWHVAFLKLMFAIGSISVAAAIVMMFWSPTSTFLPTFNTLHSDIGGAQGIIDLARDNGLTSWGFSWGTTLAATIGTWWLMSGYEMAQFFSGEIKKAGRTMMIGTISAAIVGGLVYIVLTQGLLWMTGEELFHSSIYLWAIEAWPIEWPLVTWIVPMLTSSPWVIVLIGIGFICWIMALAMAGLLWHSRCMMAWGFDRITPTKLSAVHPRYHTPITAIVIAGLISLIGVWVSTFTTILDLFLNLAIGWVLLYTSEGIAAMIFPIRLKGVHEKSPIGKYHIGPIPVISILGAIVGGFVAFIGYMSFIGEPSLGGLTAINFEVYLAVLIILVIWYYVARWYHLKKEGIDIAYSFKALPPE